MDNKSKRLLLNFLIEIVIYGMLLAVYFLLVLRYLSQPLNQLFHLDPWVYAFATLLLIVVQSVALESVTSFLLDRLGLEKVD